MIARTSNAGENWEKIYDTTGFGNEIISLSLINDSTIYAHGLNPLLTTNAGKDWIKTSNPCFDNNVTYLDQLIKFSNDYIIARSSIYYIIKYSGNMILQSPQIISPKIVDALPLDFELEWTPVEGADRYHLEIVQRDGVPFDSIRPPVNFDTTLFFSDSNITITNYKLTGTGYFKEYSCRLRAINNSQSSPWLAKVFTTQENVGVNESKNTTDLIYINPNPVSDFLYIKSLKENPFDKIQIFSTLGIKVFESELIEKIDVSNLSLGLYIIKIGNKINKFMKI
jgi:hypothetical protein